VRELTVLTHGRPEETAPALRRLAELAAAAGVSLRLDEDEARKHPLEGVEGVQLGVPLKQEVELCVVLGGGRERKEDTIDLAVGLEFHKKVGDIVKRGEPLCTMHYNSDARLSEARQLVEQSYHVAPAPPKQIRPLVHRVIGA